MSKIAKFELFLKLATTALLAITFTSYFSFNYFYLYGHIESVYVFLFCLLQWIKIAGLVVIPMAVYYKSSRFDAVIKVLYIAVPLLSLFWCREYFSLQKSVSTDLEILYLEINNFLPSIVVKIFFVLEAVLMSMIALLYTIYKKIINKELRKDNEFIEKVALNDKIKKDAMSFLYFLPVFALCMPLNIFAPLVNKMSPTVYGFLRFKNFSLWHFTAIFVSICSVVFCFFFLKNKSSTARYRYLATLSFVLLLQYMSKNSMLIGDGYSIYQTLFSAIPLFVCNLGVFVSSVAIFSRNKALSKIAFFVHSAGAIIVFTYFGADELSDFGTIFSYSFLYFTSTHTMLFLISFLPVLTGEQSFRFKDSFLPVAYYAFFIISASIVSRVISSITFIYNDASVNIIPNYSFTQVLPIQVPLPTLNIKLFSLNFDLIPLSILFFAYILIFYAIYFLYFLVFKGQQKMKQKNK